jgi:hypothetical protein
VVQAVKISQSDPVICAEGICPYVNTHMLLRQLSV